MFEIWLLLTALLAIPNGSSGGPVSGQLQPDAMNNALSRD